MVTSAALESPLVYPDLRTAAPSQIPRPGSRETADAPAVNFMLPVPSAAGIYWQCRQVETVTGMSSGSLSHLSTSTQRIPLRPTTACWRLQQTQLQPVKRVLPLTLTVESRSVTGASEEPTALKSVTPLFCGSSPARTLRHSSPRFCRNPSVYIAKASSTRLSFSFEKYWSPNAIAGL